MVKSVYFICCSPSQPERTGYEHQILSIAEGLNCLGVMSYCNINYWRERESECSYVIKNNPSISFKECDVVVFSSNFLSTEGIGNLPKKLFDKGRKYKLIFIDQADGVVTPGFDIHNEVDIVLKSHYNLKYNYPRNFRPWQFGLTNRIINATLPERVTTRNNDILVNFRVKHSTREIASKWILPVIGKYLTPNEATESLTENVSNLDRLFWQQTGRRHYASYYRRLNSSTACACFGGYFQKSIPFQQNKIGYFLSHLDYKFKIFSFNKVYQYDSWRFWESLVAGCCTFHIDLERYGAVLPVMPINGIHYLGVDFNNPSTFEKQLAKGIEHLHKIGEQGRAWVLENYSPKATAERFLDLIKSFSN
ncbi:glycosyltransferase [Pontibacter locisalis]|uniref:Glycosyltransferase n=1 Tax=Pontibacter locisalis TaxID=1719035 RepID=A0ABW5IQI2_9BACT